MRRPVPPVFVDVAAWVDSESADPVQRQRRQAIHILLAAVAGIRPAYTLYLKGGLLLGLAHGSPRMTVDVDMTAGFRPGDGIDDRIRDALDRTLNATAAALGYTGTRTEVCAIRKRPATDIGEAGFPALRITVEHLSRTGGRERRDRIPMDVSFNEPDVVSVDILDIGNGIELHAYGLVDVIAEKYRARGIEPGIGSIDDPEVRAMARARWDTIGLEVGILPEFDPCFETVRRFYRELPWEPCPGSSPTQV